MKKYLLVCLVFVLVACSAQADPSIEIAIHAHNPNWIMEPTLVPIPVTGGRAITPTPYEDEITPLEVEAPAEVVLPVVPDRCNPGYDFSFEQALVDAINTERAKYDLSALALNDALVRTARDHTADMACNRYVSHTGLDGSTPGERMVAHGYEWLFFGENIAAGPRFATAERVVTAWMKSPQHRANILSSDFIEVGVGYESLEKSSYTNYWTAVFGAP